MGASTDIARGKIERETAMIEYRRAQVELAGKHCGIVISALGFGTALIVPTTVLLLHLLG